MLRKAFTLVELIVVITILAILSTVAFVSFSGYALESRNSKRTSDITNISRQVELKLLSGNDIFSFVSNSGSRIKDNIKISGRRGSGITIEQYNAGDINNVALGVNSNVIMDPVGTSGYKIGVTNISGNFYEIAGTIESKGGDLSIFVKGSWNPRKQIHFERDGEAAHTNVYSFIRTSDFNIRARDIVQINTGKYEVLKINNNKLYLDRVVDPSGEKVFLPSDESIHLIKRRSSSDYPISEGGSSYVPYLLK